MGTASLSTAGDRQGTSSQLAREKRLPVGKEVAGRKEVAGLEPECLACPRSATTHCNSPKG